MAVVTTKSAAITARDTNAIANGGLVGAKVLRSIGSVAVANGDSIASKLILVSLPSNVIIHSIQLSCSAITSAAADVGLYRATADGGAVVDVDAFAAAQSIATALNNLQLRGLIDANKITIERRLWEIAGLSADSNTHYDVVATLTAAATAAGTVNLTVEYSA